jgi:hypothetical protein
MPGFAEQHDAQRVIDFRVSQQDAFDWDVPNRGDGLCLQPAQLVADVRRCIQKEPASAICTDGGRRL